MTAALFTAEAEARRAYLRQLAVIAEIDTRALAAELGYRDTATLLGATLRICTREANQRVANARAITPLRSVTGAEVPAPMPATAAAVAAGTVNPEQLTVLQQILSSAAKLTDPDSYAEAEHTLVRLAEQAKPEDVRKAGNHLLAYLNQDGKEPNPDDPHTAGPKREFRSHTDKTGWLKFTGQIDPETAAILEGLFDALAKPRPADQATGEPDDRGPQQRHGDALADIITAAARTGEDQLPTRGGETAAITVTVDLHDLKQQINDQLDEPFPTDTDADTNGHRRHGRSGGSLPGAHKRRPWLPAATAVLTPAQIRRIACDAKIIPALLGTRSEPLDMGRAVRTATPAQRRALAIRDGGCAYPGCTRKLKWTTAHHIIAWADGGTTDLSNMVLLCDRCHRRIHHPGWTITIHNGHAWFTPPAWIDPTRKPIRNTAHDPPRLN
ncbi:MAG: DUF222 domain-containing protein [Gemmatimonadota bacterium]